MQRVGLDDDDDDDNETCVLGFAKTSLSLPVQTY